MTFQRAASKKPVCSPLTMFLERRRNRAVLAIATAVGICLPAALNLNILPSPSDATSFLRRGLSIKEYRAAVGPPTELLPTWARTFLASSYSTPRPSRETAMFWHVPKSGGTTVKSLYECMGQTLANRVGGMEQFGHHEDAEIVVFQPFPQSDIQTVNVDVTSKEGILRAGEMGLAASGKVDLIVTSKPHFASMHLFDEEHIGRVLAMFRHPVDRAVSKFYYLQTATWERTYRPEWAEISLEQWAGMKKGNNDQNYLVRELNGKNFRDKVDENDLEVAKEMLRQRFTVGLMTKMEESIRRFNVVLGLDGRVDKRVRDCMQQTFGPKEEVAPGAEAPGAEVKQNSNKHPKVEPGSEAYKILAERNYLDVQLYDYAVQLFMAQRTVVEEFMVRADLKIERKATRKNEGHEKRTLDRRAAKADERERLNKQRVEDGVEEHEAAGLPAVAADEPIAAGESIADIQLDPVNIVVKEEQQPAAIVDLSIADVSITENQLDSVNPVIKEELKPAAIADESIGGNQWDFTNAAERQEKEQNNRLGATAALS